MAFSIFSVNCCNGLVIIIRQNILYTDFYYLAFMRGVCGGLQGIFLSFAVNMTYNIMQKLEA